MADSTSREQVEQLNDLIKTRIENLRPKLLDLSRRNPLISTRLSPRSNSVIRVVDELPDVLFFSLRNQQRMCFQPLPPLEENPKDEESRIFQDALSEARLTDERYLAEIDAVDLDSDQSAEAARQVERDLRDRLRADLGMAERQTRTAISVEQHAKNNEISPSYELPDPSDPHEDGRHGDDLIQTLWLPKDLERKLNGLLSKSTTWIQETGINVLHAAFGFLEWAELGDSTTAFAPLVLLPVQIEKEKGGDGLLFWVSAAGEDPETNLVLAQKMRSEFGVEIPRFSGGSIEEYLAEVSALAPKSVRWRVRRQVTFGAFPSSRLAMYNDLDTSRGRFDQHTVISALFGGTAPGEATPFADEYEVDHPDIEKKVPLLVLDADSSQFSAIVDIADDKNLALQGPPGTGKSQTIVNAIATAIADGKKVLFVAEKMAALEVVKSRLEAVGLGEFLLPLQAERSNRSQVISSLRQRLEMSVSDPGRKLDKKMARFRESRSELAKYIDVISSEFGETGLTVHEILGKTIASEDILASAPRSLQTPCDQALASVSAAGLEDVVDAATAFEDAWRRTNACSSHWRGIPLTHADRFTAERYCGLANDAHDATAALLDAREALEPAKLLKTTNLATLNSVLEVVSTLNKSSLALDMDLVIRLVESRETTMIRAFLEGCENFQRAQRSLRETFDIPLDLALPNALREIAATCEQAGVQTLAAADWSAAIERKTQSLADGNQVSSILKPLVAIFPYAGSMPVPIVREAGKLIRTTSNTILDLRSTATTDPKGIAIAQRLCERGKALQKQREDVEACVSSSIGATADELIEFAATFRRAGLFSIFSPTYRKAKRTYLANTRRETFDKELAATDCQMLADWKRDLDDYCQSGQVAAIFAIHFDGLNTDFDSFAALAEYVATVDASFDGPANEKLRDFLKNAPGNELQALPDLEGLDWEGTFGGLEGDLAEAGKELESYTEATKAIARLLAPIELKKYPEVSALPALAADIIDVAAKRTRLDGDEAAKTLFGPLFNGASTNLPLLQETTGAVDLFHRHPTLTDRLIGWFRSGNGRAVEARLRRVVERESEATRLLDELVKETGVPFSKRLDNVALADRLETLRAAAQDREGVFAYSALNSARAALEANGTSWIVDALEKENQPIEGLAAKIEAVVLRCIAVGVFSKHGQALANFSGQQLDKLRSSLARHDREIISLARERIRSLAHASASPPAGNGVGRKSQWTEMALITNEVNKKQRFISVRDLTRRAGGALKELKPCWMVSPLAVAQYLPSGKGSEFDLCIIDEASQMPPEDSVGAIARAKRVMVVGDTNQLPPTSFFKKLFDDDAIDDDETVLEESILEMANGVFRPGRQLRWHYRSRHSGLIKFSNHYVYDDNLIVFPSAQEYRSDMGVELVSAPGRYRAGLNAEEASVVVDAALRFMSREPGRSLGIVTLNQKQRDLVMEEMDHALGRDASASNYVDDWSERNDGLESFFVKNLENVQGDERDVIFISTVYGPEEPGGPVMQRFGPINGLAGKRRLNVLFSRAKEKIVTFSSMTAADIRAEDNGNPGVYMLKQWLEYSATGVLHAGEKTYREPDSDFEIYVMQQVTAAGCEAVPQVGVAGYFVDIGVKHPSWPHGYIMGVECDGATYHSSRSARDRDRLREEVLTGLGWYLHRIWSTDWFNDPPKEANRLREIIQKRLVFLRSDTEKQGHREPAEQPPVDDGFRYATENADVEERDQLKDTAPPPPLPVTDTRPVPRASYVEVGDRVRVRYLSGDLAERVVDLTSGPSNPNEGVINAGTPLGEALLGAEVDDEVDILAGNRLQKAIVTEIRKKPRDSNAGSGSRIEEQKSDNDQRVLPGAQSSANSDARSRTERKLDPDSFYETSYRKIIRALAIEAIDSIGPITLPHLAGIIARAHGFKRTGAQIRGQVEKAIFGARAHSTAQDKEKVFWPTGKEPRRWIGFRGLNIENVQRNWRDIPYPERLGLAMEARSRHSDLKAVDFMASRIGLSRLRQTTRVEFEKLLKTARAAMEDSKDRMA